MDDLGAEVFSPFADIAHNPIDSDFFQTKFYNVITDTYSGARPKDKMIFERERSKPFCDTCGKSSACRHQKKRRDAKSFKWGINPILQIMKCLGLLHTKGSGKYRWFTPSLLFAIFASMTIWLNFLRLFFAYDEDDTFGSKLFLKITVHVVYGQAALVSTLYILYISQELATLISLLDEFSFRNNCRSGDYIRTLTVRYIFIAVVLVLSVASFRLTVFFTDDKDSIYAKRFLLPFYQEEAIPPLYARLLYVVYSMYLSCVWIFPTALLVVICFALRRHFQQISNHMTKVYSGGGNDIGVHVETFRRRHQKLCRLVQKTDETFSLYNLIVYLTCIPLLCFVIYNFAFNPYDGHIFSLVVSIGQLIIFNVQMGLLTAAASALCQSAMAPKNALFDIDLEEGRANFHKAVQIMAFLQRVAQGHIGLTAWNLFNINKQTILMITTMVLSYVFVLIKFGLTLEYKPTLPDVDGFIQNINGTNFTCLTEDVKKTIEEFNDDHH